MTKRISVASGKGGVGKTLTSIQLACNLANSGYKVLLVDGDLGLANIDIVLGLESPYSLEDFLEGKIELSSMLIDIGRGVSLLPSGSGFSRLANLSFAQRVELMDGIEAVSDDFDLVVIDSGAGIHSNVIHLNSLAHEIVVVTTPEPHALTDAYAFIKVMSREFGRKSMNLIVNQTISNTQGLKISERLTEVCLSHIGSSLTTLGIVPKDELVGRAVMSRNLASEQTVHTLAGQAWSDCARRLEERLGGHSDAVSGWAELAFPMQAFRMSNSAS